MCNILDYLKEIKKHVDYIIVVGDNPIKKSELAKLDNLVDSYVFARHGEYDFGSYKIGFEVFGGDLLSAIAWQTGQYKKAHDYYEQTGNRRAALITDLWMAPSDSKSRIVQWCDSLLAKYGDLKESQLVTALKARQLSDSASVAISDSILRKWAGDTSEYGNPLRNIELEAKEPSLSIRLEGKYIHSKERPWLHVGSTNLSKVDVAVYGTKKDRRSGAPLWHATRQLSLGKAWRPATDSLRLPHVRQIQAVRNAFKQPHPVLLFNRGYRLADRRLRDVQLLCRRAHLPALGNRDKYFKLPVCHVSATSNISKDLSI